MNNDLDLRWFNFAERVGLYMVDKPRKIGRCTALIDTRDLTLFVCKSLDRDLYELDARLIIPHTLTDLGEVKALAKSLVRMRHDN